MNFWRGSHYLQSPSGATFLRPRLLSGRKQLLHPADQLTSTLANMSSSGSVLPSAARGILSSCRNPLRNSSIAPVLSTFQQVRGLKHKPKKGKEQPTKSRKAPQEFRQANLKDMPQYSLCDAMRYVLDTDVSQ